MQLFQVDAFADRLFSGNPAAVCLLEGEIELSWMQRLAAEMNLSETAFVYPAEGNIYRLRWFTPTVEVDLCGHATLAAAHVLWKNGRVDPERSIKFTTRSGNLSASHRSGWIELDFPAQPTIELEPPQALRDAMRSVGRYYGFNGSDWLVELDDLAALRACHPDMERLTCIPARGLIVTAADPSGEYDFRSRFFGPAVGVPEDPVTGSAHCALGPYWARKLGKPQLLGYQASERGGVVRVDVRGKRVGIAGQAVTVFAAELQS